VAKTLQAKKLGETRLDSLERARHELRLEGLTSSPFAEELLSRYSTGELSGDEVRQKLLEHYQQ
jgi:hypothetical protein